MQKEFVVLNFKRFRPYLCGRMRRSSVSVLRGGYVGGRAGLFRGSRRALCSATFREKSYSPLRRRLWSSHRLPATFRQRKRQYARSPGTPSDLRERQPPVHTYGTRRKDHVLAERYERASASIRRTAGIVVSSDDAIWFTDPDYANPPRLYRKQVAERDREAMRFSHRPKEDAAISRSQPTATRAG